MAFPTTYHGERKVKGGGDFHFPVSDLLSGSLFFIHGIKYHGTSQTQNMLIHRAEIKQYDSFSTIILTTGPRDFYYSMWNENQLSSYLHDISLEV